MRTLFFVIVCAACSPPPPTHTPMQTEKVEAPPPSERKKVKIEVGGVITFVVEAVTTTADDASLVRVYGQPNAIAVVGKKIGKTTLHVQTKKDGVEDVDVEVIAGEPATRALAIGETHPLSMKGVKEYSVGLPDIVATVATTDGSQLLVTGKKQGTTTILMIGKDGKNQKYEIVVVGGDRHL
jgi:Flp pilus assembly secretin CpaC